MMKPENELAMIASFYLSKFGKEGISKLGFNSYRQAFREIGERLAVNPNSVKNWRDEFDPFYDNDRKGWHRRPVRPNRLAVMQAFDDLSEQALRLVVLDILSPDSRNKVETELHSTLAEIQQLDSEKASAAKETLEYFPRGVTGRMAEEFFLHTFNAGLTPFSGELIDRRDDGAGFDFEVASPVNLNRHLVEIKGVAAESGGVTFTDKEWKTANDAQDNYFLGFVIQVFEAPRIGFMQNPAQRLSPTYRAYSVVTINWSVGNEQLADMNFVGF